MKNNIYNFKLEDNDLITVCEKCLQASCWHGEFMCENAENADITQKTVKELRELKLEHEKNWIKQKYAEELTKIDPIQFEKEYLGKFNNGK